MINWAEPKVIFGKLGWIRGPNLLDKDMVDYVLVTRLVGQGGLELRWGKCHRGNIMSVVGDKTGQSPTLYEIEVCEVMPDGRVIGPVGRYAKMHDATTLIRARIMEVGA